MHTTGFRNLFLKGRGKRLSLVRALRPLALGFMAVAMASCEDDEADPPPLPPMSVNWHVGWDGDQHAFTVAVPEPGIVTAMTYNNETFWNRITKLVITAVDEQGNRTEVFNNLSGNDIPYGHGARVRFTRPARASKVEITLHDSVNRVTFVVLGFVVE